ncbi:CocE/NonD family hydrolase [Algimonas porphyrae]|uniref:X-Pro dipeptidyl-peptidase n=1 Tax=Algimonas porphyrae TaxID=1128113 RepID=A0ABQ5V1H1_9PROT|nr:CocE/NonD family hydrolase [Algimonas porphyrae]GLQ21301.1 X-Pro dipeptidyl-peptidase [Algimonas porphyrae]
MISLLKVTALFKAAVLSLMSLCLVSPSMAQMQASPKGVSVEMHNYVPMSDDITLSATLLKPDPGMHGAGPYPTVLIFSPYGDSVASPFFRPAPRLLEAGYAVVVGDWRGTGCSVGTLDLGSDRFARDGYELIEWIADQPWSLPKVGMGGPSARGIAAWHVAATKPPSLAAIAPQTFNANIYTGMTHMGGIPTYLSPLGWSLFGQPMQDIRVMENMDAVCQVNREDHTLSSAFRSLQMLSFHHDGPQYQRQSTDHLAADIDVPTLMMLSTYDRYTPAIGAWMLDDMTVSSRLLLTNGGHGMSRMPAVKDELVRWFDHWLKGDPNGVDKLSAVRIYFDTNKDVEPGYVRDYQTWPPKNMDVMTLALNADGRLTEDDPDKGRFTYEISDLPEGFDKPVAEVSTRYDAAWQTFEAVADHGVTFISEPVDEDRELVGEIRFDLRASVSTVDADLIAILSEERANGNVSFLLRTGLRASHREVDQAATMREGRLIHPHRQSIPLEPGQAYTFEMAFPPIAHRMVAGSRLRLDLIPVWVATAHMGWDLASVPYAGAVTVITGGEKPSTLRVPFQSVLSGTPEPIACNDRPNQPCRMIDPENTDIVKDVLDDL